MGGRFQPFVLLTTDWPFRIETKVRFFGFDLKLYVANIYIYDIWFFDIKMLMITGAQKSPSNLYLFLVKSS